jgi:hypothetical protein
MNDSRRYGKIGQEFTWLKGFDLSTLRAVLGEPRPPTVSALLERPHWWALYRAWAQERPCRTEVEQVQLGLDLRETDTPQFHSALARLEQTFPRFHASLGRLKSISKPMLHQLVGVH